ncbi:hypothetical protein HDU87_007634 [Geranomyces variabilis]|uniref:Myb-like domain-containing protein n=1 Tax=Geranomyces variabilis TaxID=109894 RepID=A0AAD5TEI8_9FUNG|nr:hypothetical protein HDU87_007634 [Geranomyces variabilis]
MRIEDLNTSDFFSDDTRPDLPSSPGTPRRSALPAYPPFSPTCSNLGGAALSDDTDNESETAALAELLKEGTPFSVPTTASMTPSELTLGDEADAQSGSPPAAEEDPVAKEKQEWVKKMRLMFCVREDLEITKNIVHPDGTLNQDYFRPPKGSTLKNEEVKKWTDKERDLLVKGIEVYGIGHFREISESYLPDWQPNDLRVKAMRLVGRQNLQEYKDWKGDAADIKLEFDRNKEIGLRLGCWKSGVLVFDDDGKVEAEVRANPVKRAADAANDRNRGDKKQRKG